MKNLYLVLFCALSLLITSSCVEKSAKYKTLQNQFMSLQDNYSDQKNQLDEIFSTLNEIESGLSSIREQEKILTVETSKEGTLPAGQKEQIKSSIVAIQAAIEHYKQQIEDLKKENGVKSIEFRKRLNALAEELDQKSETIATLSKQIEEKDRIIKEQGEKIETLDKEVADLNKSIETLNEASALMQETISAQDTKIYAAYYIVGTKEDLKKSGILTGGGLFKASKISYQSDQNKNSFIKIDYRTISTINTNAKKAKVLSNHPAESYSIDEVDEEAVLTISNPEEFWEQTKYLVILVQ